MASNEESSQPAETQRHSIPIGSTSISINLSFVKSLLGIFEGAIIVRITVFLTHCMRCDLCVEIIKISRIFERIKFFSFFFLKFLLQIVIYLGDTKLFKDFIKLLYKPYLSVIIFVAQFSYTFCGFNDNLRT